ncbi:hypothetical protein NLG97_g5905 [Lecanicillium saksenae]|uniref:Uncharacterized protein n=1 Tax=Lecanicillium saksenae TaxID=468837 RepID=A0ACC1QUB4_9HYPO|nr:hypothetical protein NLG97_g5905 [Lecanicillium saksenae]
MPEIATAIAIASGYHMGREWPQRAAISSDRIISMVLWQCVLFPSEHVSQSLECSSLHPNLGEWLLRNVLCVLSAFPDLKHIVVGEMPTRRYSLVIAAFMAGILSKKQSSLDDFVCEENVALILLRRAVFAMNMQTPGRCVSELLFLQHRADAAIHKEKPGSSLPRKRRLSD